MLALKVIGTAAILWAVTFGLMVALGEPRKRAALSSLVMLGLTGIGLGAGWLIAWLWGFA